MRLKSLLLAAALAAAPLSALAQTPPAPPAPAAPPKPIAPSKIILVGDSTTAVMGGWGPSFCGKHVTHMLACINLGRGGRSTVSYVREGSWDVALAEMKGGGFAATYVTLQFGHNDQPGKPYPSDPDGQFPANLRRYVTEARAAGAIPILVTPLTRRNFVNGKIVDTLGPWAEATRKVAAEMNVPLVDLYARSTAAVEAMGPEATTLLTQAPPTAEEVAMARSGTTSPTSRPVAPPPGPPTPEGMDPMATPNRPYDTTHLGEKGADVFAALVTDELARVVPALRKFLLP